FAVCAGRNGLPGRPTTGVRPADPKPDESLSVGGNRAGPPERIRLFSLASRQAVPASFSKFSLWDELFPGFPCRTSSFRRLEFLGSINDFIEKNSIRFVEF